MSDSIRQNKVARLVQKELGNLFVSGKIGSAGALVSVTVVRISPDLSFTKVYLSVFPPEKREIVLSLMQGQISEIRRELGNSVRHQLRIVPELAFFIDDSFDDALKIENLLKKK